MPGSGRRRAGPGQAHMLAGMARAQGGAQGCWRDQHSAAGRGRTITHPDEHIRGQAGQRAEGLGAVRGVDAQQASKVCACF